jgi:tetratricopeptide (TPR) repeat protein
MSARLPRRKIMLAAGSALLTVVLLVTFWKQVRLWKDDLSLFQQALAVTKNNYLAHAKVEFTLAQKGQLGDARYHYEEALRINLAAQGVHNQLGIPSASTGKVDEAVSYFTEAIRLRPNNVVARNNLGIAFLSQGKLDQGLFHFKASLRIKPGDPKIQFLTGMALAREGRFNEATPHFRETLRSIRIMQGPTMISGLLSPDKAIRVEQFFISGKLKKTFNPLWLAKDSSNEP